MPCGSMFLHFNVASDKARRYARDDFTNTVFMSLMCLTACWVLPSRDDMVDTV